mgnify:CR=1 FL=1
MVVFWTDQLVTTRPQAHSTFKFQNNKGELVKQKYGPGMLTGFKLLAKLKGLRGTALDIFGRSQERQTERALIGEYMQHLEQAIEHLDQDSHAHALNVAKVPENIKGFGHVKERNIRVARQQWQALQTPSAAQQAN